MFSLEHVQLQFAGYLKRLFHVSIDSEWYEVVKNESVKDT